MPVDPGRTKHDEAYKLLFSSAAMVEDLLTHILPEFAKRVDMPKLRMLSPSFVKAEGLQQRHADMLWRAQLREHD
ncbi:MAG: Rpn family recombination-promoting nuclease/putative transposase [Gemmatimonadota bacterium]|nr:Rpn family recombination-promoting nuclease/putative transposase [Gemmatimonadota bacterium]